MKVTTDIQIDDSHEANIRRLQEDYLVSMLRSKPSVFRRTA